MVTSESPLSIEILRSAYSKGFFPMPHPETGELMWLNPDPRAILPLDAFHCSRSLERTKRRGRYRTTFDGAFSEVMHACADRAEGTWITSAFLTGYQELHRTGGAHSVESWEGDVLVGGLYGVALGGAFFAESKFHKARDASKIALFALVEHLRERGFALLEVQFLTPHLASLGAIEIPRVRYLQTLVDALRLPATF